MADPARSVLLLAGRLGLHDEGWSITPLLDRIEHLGYCAQALCIEAVGDAVSDPRVFEFPGLGQRWGWHLAIRALRLGERLNKPALLHVLQTNMSEIGLAIAEHWRLPYVQTIEEFIPDGERIRLSERWCRRVVATSRELAAHLETELRIPPRLLSVISPGIETPEPEPAWLTVGKVPVIGTAGPLVATSGFATFLNAARHVIDSGLDAEFVIAGQGEDEVDLRRRADRLRIADRVTFAGIPVVGLRFWNVLDIFCQPSLAPSSGLSLATALAFGVPSIASDLEGLRSLITNGKNGLLVPPGDSEALEHAILALLADPERAAALGQESRELIRNEFDPDLEVKQLVSLYDCVRAPDAALTLSKPLA